MQLFQKRDIITFSCNPTKPRGKEWLIIIHEIISIIDIYLEADLSLKEHALNLKHEKRII